MILSRCQSCPPAREILKTLSDVTSQIKSNLTEGPPPFAPYSENPVPFEFKFQEKSQIFEKLISSAEANRYETRFTGGTLSSLKRCKTYNDFASWINGWEKAYTAELNKAYMLNNSNNRMNQTMNIFNKYAFYSDGYQEGPVRGWVIQLALNKDISQNQVDVLEKKIDAAYERCGDLYSKCIKK